MFDTWGVRMCTSNAVPQKVHSQSVLLQKLQDIEIRELDSENEISLTF